MTCFRLLKNWKLAVNSMIIGITGGIGSGKSRVARYWSMAFRLKLLNLDGLCRQLLLKEKPGWLAIKNELGDKRFFTDTGELDRKNLRRAIFVDSALRDRVDRRLHPLVKAKMADICRQNDKGNDNSTLWVVEIPLLFEAGWQDEVETVIVVYADISTRISRIMDRDGVSEEEAFMAVSSQKTLEEKAEQADFVIENDDTWLSTCRQVLFLGRLLGKKC